MEHRYHLAKKGKWICPECGKRTFVLYVDERGNPLDETVGKCDRLLNCGFHNPPRNYFETHKKTKMSQYNQPFRPRRVEAREPSYIAPNVLKKSMGRVEDNSLVRFLTALFARDSLFDNGNESAVMRMVNEYYIGTSDRWQGATIFWRVDVSGRIRDGKVMAYDSTGHRVKQPHDLISWVHSDLKMPDYNLTHCLYGEHRLNRMGDDDVAFVVESEKTALLMSGLFYDCFCFATGGCEMFTEKICEPLAGRDLVVIPDNGWFDKWSNVARKLRYKCRSVKVLDIMETMARKPGDDVGDLIVEGITKGSYLDIARTIANATVNSPVL